MSVRHALLAFLSEGPKYGLQLRQEFEESTGQVWPLNVGQVYTTLQRLERDELIESDDRGEAVSYTHLDVYKRQPRRRPHHDADRHVCDQLASGVTTVNPAFTAAVSTKSCGAVLRRPTPRR